MRVLPIHVIPIFLGQTLPYDETAAQVRYFDAYYRTPPAIGFHVIGCEGDTTPIVGLSVLTTRDECVPEVSGLIVESDRCERLDSGVVGFAVSEFSTEEGVQGFSVNSQDEGPELSGFYAYDAEDDESVIGFTATCEEPEKDSVIGFIVEGA